jgi:hypothetical protein
MAPCGGMPNDAPSGDLSWRLELGLGALLVAVSVVFAAFALPRLTNNAFGDFEFSGWSGAVAVEIARGRAPYVDFVSPIPLGSLVLLSWLQKLSGEVLIVNELRVIAACQLVMAGLAYALARRFTSRRNAWLVAFASLVTLLRGPKECAYDHTAELIAWGSIALGAAAMVTENALRRWILWLGCGTFATFTLAFKQSTGSGIVLGWLAAFLYLAVFAFRGTTRAPLGRAVLAWAMGCGVGVAALCVLLAAYGSSLGAYYQDVFRDASTLKGGKLPMAMNLLRYLLGGTAYPSSLLVTLLLAVVLIRILSRPGGLSLTEGNESRVTPRDCIAVGTPVVIVFGIAIFLLGTRVHALPNSLLRWSGRLSLVPSCGLLFACVYFIAQLSGRSPAQPAGPERGHALNALFLAALVTSLLHNLSAPEFRPFYDPNPLIPVALLFLFGALDRAGLPKTKLVVFALSLFALFSPKLDRAVSAQLSMGHDGYWAGMLANENGARLMRLSQRVRQLTSAEDTVLVLPEDLELRSLIGRPRPPIRGAVVFVDQYASRLTDADLATLEHDLPKVVVIRPSERPLWIVFFAVWTTRSGAQRITERFLDDWLPAHYVKDSTFPTVFDSRMVSAEVWVRRN